MNTYLFSKIVPDHIKGKSTSLEESFTPGTREEATDIFRRACKRLLNVKIWHELSGFGSGEFKLTDVDGNEIHKLAEIGNFFKIDLPGPGTTSGDGYDWVKVEAIIDNSNAEAEEESFGMRVRACSNPHTAGSNTAHFFTHDATSSFMIVRENNTVTAFYYGRNEILNTATDSVIDKVRNAIAGTVALLGVSELHWTRLLKGLLSAKI